MQYRVVSYLACWNWSVNCNYHWLDTRPDNVALMLQLDNGSKDSILPQHSDLSCDCKIRQSYAGHNTRLASSKHLLYLALDINWIDWRLNWKILKSISYWLASALMMCHDDQMITRSVGTSPSEGIFPSVWLFVLAGDWQLGDMSRYDALCAPGYWQYVSSGDSFLPSSRVTLSPYHHWDIVGNSYHGKWKMTRWTRSVLTCVCREAIGDCDIILEQPGLIWQLRRELKVCKCTGMIVGMVGSGLVWYW